MTDGRVQVSQRSRRLPRLRAASALAAIGWRADPTRLVALGVMKVVSSVNGGLSALWVKLLVDRAAGTDGSAAVLLPAAGLAFSVASIAALHYAEHRVQLTLSEKANHLLDVRTVELVSGAPSLDVHESPEIARELGVFLDNRWELSETLPAVVGVFQHVIRVLVVATLYISVHPALLLLPLFGLPGMVFGTASSDLFFTAGERAWPHLGRARHVFDLATSAGPAKEIRVFGLASELLRQLHASTDAAIAVQRRLWTRGSMIGFCTTAVFVVGYAGALLFVTERAARGELSSGDIVLTVILANQAMGLTFESSDILRWAMRTLRIAGCYVAIERFVHETAASGTAGPPELLRRGVTLDGVSYRYRSAGLDALQEVSLEIPAGSVVAIVGENGAGKTTLVKLLCGLYRPTAGVIRVDGVELETLEPSRWRLHTAAAFQDATRFEFSVRHAVGLGDLTHIEHDYAVAGALERASAADLLTTLPDGLDTQLGTTYEGGTELSEGQWQKVALARAMMREAPLLLVLDEPTASLDAPTEHALFERYADASRRDPHSITVLVSHRFSTVRMADLIVVVHDGRVIENGTHAELIALGGTYAELFELQARSYR